MMFAPAVGYGYYRPDSPACSKRRAGRGNLPFPVRFRTQRGIFSLFGLPPPITSDFDRFFQYAEKPAPTGDSNDENVLTDTA